MTKPRRQAPSSPSRARRDRSRDNPIRIRARRASLLCAFVVGLSAGCDGTKVAPAPADGDAGGDDASELGAVTPDTGPDSPPADGGFDGPCMLPLDQAPMPFGGCPARVSDPAWSRPLCSFMFGTAWEQSCEGYFSRQIDLGTHGWTCYYDPTSQALVAGRFADDVPSFCGMTSSVVVYGTIPAAGACTTPDPITYGCESADGGMDAR